MLNLDALDQLIAVVVVLLILSLIVQSIQAAIKKFFRIKSLQLEQSLVHLFYYVLDKDALKSMRTVSDRMPVLRALYRIPIIRGFLPERVQAPAKRDPQVEALYRAVTEEFLRAGRVSPRGKLLIDSISKAELIKFIGQVKVEDLIKHIPQDDTQKLAEIGEKIGAAQAAVRQFNNKYHSLIEKTPLAANIQPLLRLFENADLFLDLNNSDLTLGDLAASAVSDANKVLEALPDSVEQTIAQLKDDAHKEAAEALQKLHKILSPLAEEMGAVISLPRRLSQLSGKVDAWYETLRQSFEERYVRSMKTCSLAISFAVVFLLNANLFSIYRELSANEAKRNLIVQSSDQITKALGEQQAATTQQINQTLDEWARRSYADIEKNVSLYTALGFSGPQWILDIPQKARQAGARGVIETIIGWLVMTMLLSVGAPFWQDALESLFGVKNLLRKQGKAEEQPEQ
jgi:hypothetical protein